MKYTPNGDTFLLNDEINIDEVPTLTDIVNTMRKDKIDYTAKRLDYVICVLNVLIDGTGARGSINPGVMQVLDTMVKSSNDRINQYGDEARAKEKYLELRSQLRELENDYPVLQDLK